MLLKELTKQPLNTEYYTRSKFKFFESLQSIIGVPDIDYLAKCTIDGCSAPPEDKSPYLSYLYSIGLNLASMKQKFHGVFARDLLFPFYK